jgi:hypothetical protein
MTAGTSETVKTTSEASGMTPETERRFGTTATTFGTTQRTVVAFGTTISLSEETPGHFTVITRTAHTRIIDYIIMLCGFESDSVFVKYIAQAGWSELSHVTSMSLTNINEVHTVEYYGGVYKKRPLEKDIQVFKGLLLFHARMSRSLNRRLDADDVMTLFTKSVFYCYLHSEEYCFDMFTSGPNRIQSFDKVTRAGVFHVESARPCVLVSNEGLNDKQDVVLDVTTVNNGNSKESLFVTAWKDDALKNDAEEYEVLFEEEDVKSGYLSCALIGDCSNVGEEELVLQPDVSVLCIIQEWGATYDKMCGGLNVIQSGTSKQEALNGIENGEQMFVVFNQRMLIAVLNSTRVFDPGGQDKKMKKVNQNIIVQQ